MLGIRRREFLTALGGAAAWPLAARAQQPVPVVALFNSAPVDSSNPLSLLAFPKGLEELGFVEGRNVAIEYHFLGGQYEGLRLDDRRDATHRVAHGDARRKRS
jgi:putative tryptophan/tyrosine transport system substrate-binding protein